MLLEKGIEKRFRPSKICIPQAVKRSREVNQIAARREGQDAKRSQSFEALTARDGNSFAGHR